MTGSGKIDQNYFIGASLSEPHISELSFALMFVCLLYDQCTPRGPLRNIRKWPKTLRFSNISHSKQLAVQKKASRNGYIVGAGRRLDGVS